MNKGAIDIVLQRRADREKENRAKAIQEEAVANLNKLGVEREEKCPVNGFYDFAMTVFDHFVLQNALGVAKEKAIRVVITDMESHIGEADTIFINCTSTDIDALKFLRGD